MADIEVETRPHDDVVVLSIVVDDNPPVVVTLNRRNARIIGQALIYQRPGIRHFDPQAPAPAVK